MTSRRARFLFVAVLLLLAGLLALFLFSRLQPYTETIDLGPAPEARRNPYLAAELFLRKQGVAVNRADGLETLKGLPPAGHTLLLLGSRAGMTPAQARRLLAWSEQGGHLVLVAERLWDEDEKKSGDLLLDSLDIRQYLTEDFDDSQDQAREQAQADEEVAEEDEAVDTPPADTAEEDAQTPADATPDHSALTRLYLENEQSPAYIGFDPDYHLYDPQNHAYAWANSGDATHLLQMQHGKGLVTVLTDAWIWQNRNIEQYDNAWLLWYLTQDNQVTLLYRAERDSLATLLARHFPEALAAALLLLLGGLWRAGLRQGPLQPVASRSRRQLEEHLRAGADFLLRQRGHVALLHGLQRDILRRARRRHPGFEQLGVAEQWQILGRMTRLPPSAISQAMRPYPAQRLSAADFTRQVAHLQSLRNAL
ncbi:DUF4350 domain-containing protein [Pseudomonas aeruginosa]|uniref:DUF4350 domain-containing protein n=1 Tax=Pseudomonas aeruginosa TaxID=287 RepID=UPI00071B60F6|nr:DUF4350 domain-containing protein [Pseudomonas aeruginosa]KSR38187.1 hypothetical protein APB45_27645 [Pseudomonas aeruginosa]RPV08110.1 DUF4350 domain-containing protein [Pseudomonas aeruginosa]